MEVSQILFELIRTLRKIRDGYEDALLLMAKLIDHLCGKEARRLMYTAMEFEKEKGFINETIEFLKTLLGGENE